MPPTSDIRHDVLMTPDARGRAFTSGDQGVPWSSAAEVEQSRGLWDSAANLLDKIAIALLDDDQPRAQTLAARAAALPYDEREEIWPGVFVAGQQIFNTLTDAVEEWPVDDSSWIGIVEDMATESELASVEMRHVAAVLAHTATLVELSAIEKKRLARLAGDSDPMLIPAQEISPEEHAGSILELVRIEQRLVDLVAERLDELESDG